MCIFQLFATSIILSQRLITSSYVKQLSVLKMEIQNGDFGTEGAMIQLTYFEFVAVLKTFDIIFIDVTTNVSTLDNRYSKVKQILQVYLPHCHIQSLH